MAHLTGEDMDFKIDNASESLTSIKGSINSVSLSSVRTMLEDLGLGDKYGSSVAGVQKANLPLNGWVDSTTEAIFGPLVGINTSTQKTWAVKFGPSWFTGEAEVENVEYSGAPDTLQTFSCGLNVQGQVTRTSVEPS